MVQKKIKTTRQKVSSTRKKNNKLTDAELLHFRNILMQKRREIVGSVNEIYGEAVNKSRLDASGDLSSMPIHMADLGTDNYEQEFALDLVDEEKKLLIEIDKALLRIQDKRYGICLSTGKKIRKARLEAKPWAKYCVEYARLIEQGLAEDIDPIQSDK